MIPTRSFAISAFPINNRLFLPAIFPPRCADNKRSEVVILKSETFWELFQDTGDPLCYLLYRAAQPGAVTAKPEEKDVTADEAVRRPA